MSSKTRGAFTLVELMVTIAMLAMLASFVLMAVFGAQQQAKKSRTQAQITKLHDVLMRKWDEYRTRRVPINTASMDPETAAVARLQAIREWQRLELPDRWNDVKSPEADPVVLGTRPAVSQAYVEYYNTVNPSDIYQAAECLYMIVVIGNIDDGAGRELFNEDEIGDIDNDGAPEFHDAWGNPIMFLRWAPGFVSNTADPNIGFLSDLQEADPVNSHDPFDPRKTDDDAFALYPLIYSAGPDGKANATGATGYDIELASSFIHGGGTSPNFYDPYVDPSTAGGDPAAEPMGTPVDPDGNGREHYDNIHNHLLEAR